MYACVALRGSGKYCSIKCRPYQGAGNPKWRGGKTSERGRAVVYAPGDPNATLMGGTHAYEYRLIAARMLGRPLLPTEIVHHIDGDVANNAPENLEVMTQAAHIKRHGLPYRKRSA